MKNYLFIYYEKFYRYNLLTNNIDTIQNLPPYLKKGPINVNNDELYMTGYKYSPLEGYLFKSTNNGLSWSIFNSVMVPYVNSFLMLNQTIIFASSLGIYKSLDNGMSFYYITNGMGYCNDLLISNGITILGSEKGAFFSVDSGSTWQSINDGFTEQTIIYKIIQAGDYLYAATYKGLWKRPLSDIVGLNHINETVGNNASAYYYENKLHINTGGLKGNAQIVICDMQGRELYNDYSYFNNLNSSKTIPINNLSKGIYVLRISNEHLIFSEKFVIQ
jgi:hypothetical protein